jgi:hypothetical protein
MVLVSLAFIRNLSLPSSIAECAFECSAALSGQHLVAVYSPSCSATRFDKAVPGTRTILRRFGPTNALDCLVSQRLRNFADAAEQHPEFAAELPRFQSAVWEIFHPFELAGYLASLPPMTGKNRRRGGTNGLDDH